MLFFRVLAASFLLHLSAAADFDYVQQGADWTGTCDTGTRQSPVDVSASEISSNPATQIEYNFDTQLVGMTIANNGHTVQVTPRDRAHYMFVGEDRRRFNMAQYHFHSPSEHTFDGAQRDLELHVVHTAADGGDDLAVIGLLFQSAPGVANLTFLQDIIDFGFPVAEGSEVSADCADLGSDCLDFESLLPDNLSDVDFVTYLGSLTTPPCSETVTWFVQMDTIPAPPEQIQAFRDHFTFEGTLGNFRAVEDSNPGKVLSRVDFGRLGDGAGHRFGTLSAVSLFVSLCTMLVV